jgi:serine/threonine protein kinase
MNSSVKEGTPNDLPRRLDRYVLLSRLYEGGMTEVYAARLAEEVGPGRLLVIKLLPEAALSDPEAEMRFLEEARIVLNLTHGNITAAFEFGRAEGRPFLVMEYVPGPSLRRLLDSATRSSSLLAVCDTLFIVREVCSALSYAHSFVGQGQVAPGIVHRDISPGNILISTAGQVKLTDFGIAQYMDSGPSGVVWGKAAYIAPEMAQGMAPEPVSDIYSLGVVLYECLTGAPPLVGDDDRQTLELVRTTLPRPPSELRPDILPALDGLVLRLLSKSPEKRFATAASLEVELGPLLNEAHASYTEPVLAQTVGRHFVADDFFGGGDGDRIRAGLLRAGVDLDGRETTGELVTNGTVPLNVARSMPATSSKTGRRRLVVALSAAAIVAAISIVLFFLRPPHSNGTMPVANHPTIVKKSPQLPPARQPETDSAAPVLPPKEVRKPGAGFKDRSLKKVRPRATSARRDKQPARKVEQGWLNINSSPWSYVSVDGKRLSGHTPHRRVQLTPGKHTLVFTNPELGLRATRQVVVKSWEENTIGVRLK